MILSTIAQYLIARIDVARARFTGKLPGGVGLPSPDRLPPLEIPSFALGEAQDRTLGEIDQDGFLFARDPRDAPFFNRRTQKVPRHHRPLLVVLRDKVVCVEKGPPYKWQAGVGHRILRAIGWEFYLEAAALLRLQGLPFIPCLFGIDTLRRVIRLEFIWGETLYHSIGHGTLDCDEVRRIFAALVQDSRCATAAEIVCMLEQMAERGVTQLDVHAANFIRGRYTETLYMVDFHLVNLAARPWMGSSAPPRIRDKEKGC